MKHKYACNIALKDLVSFDATAVWRASLIERYPTDERLKVASDLLTKMSNEATSLEDSPIHERIYNGFLDNKNADEIVSENLRAVGFGYVPANAHVFLTDVAKRLET